MISAGLVDLQVNGFAGVDFIAGGFASDDLPRACGALLATGVTCLLPTLITAAEPVLAARFMALDARDRRQHGGHCDVPRLSPGGDRSSIRPRAMLAAMIRL